MPPPSVDKNVGMAKQSAAKTPSSHSALSRLGMSARRWAASFLAPAQDITQGDSLMYGSSPITVASLLQSGRRGARMRREIYEKWSHMEGDAIVSSALSLLVTSALGGNETSGDLVFIEAKPDAKADKQKTKIVEEISRDLSRLFNKVAYQIAYTGATYGDAYARIYTTSEGVVDLYTDELVRPQLVQPYERGSRTVGFAVYTGEKCFERLDVSQLARMKMPRTQWVPQQGVIEKSIKLALTQDDIDALPIMPSMAGGSLLFVAEDAYNNLNASLLGLVGQRWMDSIDEQMLQVNLQQMTDEQQDRFIASIARMLSASKARAEDAVKSGRPVMERVRHIIPVFNDKQLTTISNSNGGGTGRTGTITIDDVMMHARLLAGAIGVDLSMLGFADQMAGGLGEGGWFRTSAQVAERARVIRVALEEFFNAIIDIHTLKRYGMVFPPGERPWEIQFYGSISALESERQRTRTDAMNSGLLLAQGIQLLKDMGANRKIMETFLVKTMLVDEAEAKVYAEITELMPKGAESGNEFGGVRPGQPGSRTPGFTAQADDEDAAPEDETLDDASLTLDALGPHLAGWMAVMALDSVDETPEPGPVFEGYENDPEGAIRKLLQERCGQALAVWNKPGLGQIDLVYGNDKAGIKKIARKHVNEHYDAIARLPALLKRGKVIRSPHRSKAFIVTTSQPAEVAVIALDWHGRRKAWIVSAYLDVRGEFTGRIERMDADTQEGAGTSIPPAHPRTPAPTLAQSQGAHQPARVTT